MTSWVAACKGPPTLSPTGLIHKNLEPTWVVFLSISLPKPQTSAKKGGTLKQMLHPKWVVFLSVSLPKPQASAKKGGTLKQMHPKCVVFLLVLLLIQTWVPSRKTLPIPNVAIHPSACAGQKLPRLRVENQEIREALTKITLSGARQGPSFFSSIYADQRLTIL